MHFLFFWLSSGWSHSGCDTHLLPSGYPLFTPWLVNHHPSPATLLPSLNFSLPESPSCRICHQIVGFPSGFPDKLPISSSTNPPIHLNFWVNQKMSLEITPYAFALVSIVWEYMSRQQASDFPHFPQYLYPQSPYTRIGSDHRSYHYVHTEEGINKRGGREGWKKEGEKKR